MPENTEVAESAVLPRRRESWWRAHGAVLAVISAGGAIGALGRYGIGQWLPTRPGQFPWGTFLVNLSGCFLIGVLMVLITEVWSAHRLARPFLGVGILGGYTTFSTYTNEIRALLQPGTMLVAAAYLLLSLAGAMVAVVCGVWLTRALAGRGERA
ncbi:fluoride efflux transporter CrcB [Amycolatopsis acidicola]|uniref:Fluoride-specific ion channel FluC n=1 Tax=Amycolatopsis acidicola TaxID=2596893 RepID=A0A5N0URQ3_9PSEU|nr:fluoride efflux transporter CrcB [Amycolatopsis acidicola]KAA9154323.1 fluoride efflux transporter CrcB [Amycolatopsis acidicola]